MSRPSDTPPYPFRMPPNMRRAVEDLAHAQRRSLNAELLAAVEYWLHINSAPAPSLTSAELALRQSPGVDFAALQAIESVERRMQAMMDRLEETRLPPRQSRTE